MTIAVALDRLREEIERFGPAAYLMTAGEDSRPHCVSVAVDWQGDALVVEAGNRTLRNAEARPLASLLWPPYESDGYSLIVDVVARAGRAANSVGLEPTNAVLHRNAPAPGAGPSSCGNDCVPLTKS